MMGLLFVGSSLFTHLHCTVWLGNVALYGCFFFIAWIGLRLACERWFLTTY